MIVWVYDRWGNQVDCLNDFIEFVYDDEAGKIETVEFTVPGTPLEKGDYLVWRDEFLNWHEDIVSSCDVIHQQAVRQHVYAEDSISELAFSYLDEKNSYNQSNTIAITRCLEDTRWTLGKIDNLGDGDIKFYHESVFDGIRSLQEVFGGEISTTKVVTKDGVSERKINWEFKRGSDNGLVFTYGFDADQIERRVEIDEVFTRVHVFGKGVPTYEDGMQTGYGRRLTFAEINGGKDYVEDDEAKEKWGLIGKNGVKVHAEGQVIYDQVEDARELLVLGEAYLKEVSKPRVSYTANLAILSDAGMDFKNANVGDTVYIRDEVLDERLTGRVTHIRRYLGNKPTEITLGNIVRTVSNVLQEQRQVLQDIHNRADIWDDAATANTDWLKNLMHNLNDEINSTGGYVYWDFGEGITVYDRKLEDSPTRCIQLKGGSFRIANSKTSTGEWDWKTFGTGDGFTADLINVGILQCGKNKIDLNNGTITLENGTITDLNGKNFWNLATGEFQLSASTTIEGKTFGDIAQGAVDAQTQEDIFNKLTNDGETQGIYLNGGKLYINGTYLRTGNILSPGGSHWNLNTGEFQTIYTVSSTTTSTSGNTTTYLDNVVCVEMTADSPFGIYSALRTRTAVKNGNVTTTTYNAPYNKQFIGGIYLVGKQAFLQAERCGTSQNTYITTGIADDGYAGVSFYDDGDNYLDIKGIIVGNKTDPGNGVEFETYTSPFMLSEKKNNKTYLWAPSNKKIDNILTSPPSEALMIERDGNVTLQKADYTGVYFENDEGKNSSVFLGGTKSSWAVMRAEQNLINALVQTPSSWHGLMITNNAAELSLSETIWINMDRTAIMARFGKQGWRLDSSGFSPIVWND